LTNLASICLLAARPWRDAQKSPDRHYCWITDGQVSDAYDALDRKQARTYSPTGNVATFTGLAGTANSTLTTYSFSADAKDNPTGT
jgi:hypothetical protein